MHRDTIVHASYVTPAAELRGACTIVDSAVLGDIIINPRAVLIGVELSGTGSIDGRVVLIAGDSFGIPVDASLDVCTGPDVHIGPGVQVLGRGWIRGNLQIYVKEAE